MKKSIFCFFLAVFILAAGTSAPEAYAENPISVSAKAAVLMDAETGRVLFAVNSDEKLAMASTTKIMTALLTLEAAETENKVITITKEMIMVEGSSMGLREGNVLTLHDLAAGMLSVSGNDAANAAAIAVEGSKEAFAEKMNQKAREIGMKNSHFVTPSGLDDEEHYSTALDMALLARYAMRNEEFASIVSQPTIRVTYQSPEQSLVFTNHNKLLKYYEGCIGVKTGFTKKAGRCLVSAAERDGVRLIAVTLNAPDDWNDHMAMFDYGFSQLSVYTPDASSCTLSLPVVGGKENSLSVRGETGDPVTILTEMQEKIVCRIEAPRFLYAGVKKGDVIGRAVYLLEGEELASLPLKAEETIELLQHEKTAWERFREWFSNLF